MVNPLFMSVNCKIALEVIGLGKAGVGRGRGGGNPRNLTSLSDYT